MPELLVTYKYYLFQVFPYFSYEASRAGPISNIRASPVLITYSMQNYKGHYYEIMCMNSMYSTCVNSMCSIAGTIHYNEFLDMMLGKKSTVLKL